MQDPTLDLLPPILKPYAPDALLRIGTSSFSSKDWVGPFYPSGMEPGRFLTHYARVFDTVEIDATYYAVPSPRTVDGWADKTPESFRICAKFPRSIVHGGRDARPNPRHLLQPDSCYEDRDRFLEVMQRLGPRLDHLLIQFPYFNRATFPSAGPFLERLARFLGDLPKTSLRYALEIRNKAWLGPDFFDLLRRHGIASTLVDQAWMPHGDQVIAKHDVETADTLYVRLLGDRKRIERITKSWGEEVLDHGDSLERWARLLADRMRADKRVLIFVNNHYAGHAPSTVRRLRALIADELEGSHDAPSPE